MASQWYIKNFKKEQAVKMIYVGNDKRIIIKWLLPENNTITYNNKSYMLHPNKMFIHKGTPSLFINFKDAEPLDPLDKSNQIYSADDFNTAISSKVGQELFEASKPKTLADLGTIISILSLVGVAYLLITMNDNFTNLLNQINEIRQIIGGA
jgi:hypothetical protein